MPEFSHHPCESTMLTSDGHNFPVQTSICAFVDSTEILLSLEFNNMKCLSKMWAEEFPRSRTIEE